MNKTIKIQGYEERVFEAIRRSGLSVSEVARRMNGRRQVFYSDHQMHLGNLAKFCSVTGCSADYILGLSREVKRK